LSAEARSAKVDVNQFRKSSQTPRQELARLVLELIRSLHTEAEAGTEEAWDAEIARRGGEVDAGIAETMTFEEY
jgi:hypothetical protein